MILGYFLIKDRLQNSPLTSLIMGIHFYYLWKLSRENNNDIFMI